MKNRTVHDLIVILGPTATGKTKLAVKIANEINGEIISADSRQVYKGMDIGTGKDLHEYIINNKKIPYHLIDIISPQKNYNVFQFQQDTKKIILELKCLTEEKDIFKKLQSVIIKFIYIQENTTTES